ncbi:MAG: 50S ribosomal protein L5 [Nanoarchaeota archaeon]
MNPMRKIRIAKVTLNIGAGKDQTILSKGVKLLEQITEVPPIKTVTQKRIAAWGLRPGLPIGCMTTLRKEPAKTLLSRLLKAKDSQLKESNFDDNGNVSFGIHEYIDIPQIKYDPEIGIIGFQVCVTLERPGYRIKRRKIMKRKIPLHHRISQQDAIEFMKQEFNIKLAED